MAVPAVHVAMTLSHELGEKVFSLPESRFLFGSITDLKRALSENSESLFARVGAPMSPVLSLNHKLPADLLELEILDPYGIFEQRILSDSRISSFVSEYMKTLTEMTTKSYKSANNVLSKKDISNIINFDDAVIRNEDGEFIDTRYSLTKFEDKALGFIKTSKLFSKFFDDATRFYDVTRSVYITYGLGDDPDNWAGPFLMKIVNVGLQYDGRGVRVLRLLLQGNQNSLASLHYSPYGTASFKTSYTIGVEGTSSPILKSKRDSNQNITNLEVEDIQNVVNSALQDYLRQIFNNDNIILALPSLADNAPTWLNSKVADFPQTNYTPIAFNFQPFDVRLEQDMSKVRLSLFQTFKALEDLNFYIGEYYNDPNEQAVVHSTVPEVRIEKLASDSLTALELIKKVDYRAVLSSEISLSDLKQEGGGLDLKSFKKFIEAYSDVCKENYPIVDLVLITETDPRVLKLWKSYDFIEDDLKSVVILGDASLIETLLYSKPNIEIQQDINLNFVSNIDYSIFKQTLLSEEYIKAMQDLVWPLPTNYPLGDLYNLPEKIGVEDIPEQTLVDLDSLKRLRTPVLKHGYQDSNILGIELSNDFAYYAALGAIISNDYETRLIDSIGDITSPDFEWFRQSLESLVNEISKLHEFRIKSGVDPFRLGVQNDIFAVYDNLPTLTNLKNNNIENVISDLLKMYTEIGYWRGRNTVIGPDGNLTKQPTIGLIGGQLQYLYPDASVEEIESKEADERYKSLIAQMTAVNRQTLALLHFLLTIQRNHEKIKQVVKTNKLLPSLSTKKEINPNKYLWSFANELNKNAVVLNVKTLPIFHISNTGRRANQKTIVLSREPMITGTNANAVSTGINRAFTGLYNIITMEHDINSKTAETRLSLVQDIEVGIDLPPESDENTSQKSIV